MEAETGMTQPLAGGCWKLPVAVKGKVNIYSSFVLDRKLIYHVSCATVTNYPKLYRKIFSRNTGDQNSK
jgi:hypothetical protein